MKQITLTCLVLAFALAGIASAQVMTQSVPAGFLAAPNNSGTSFPQNNTADHIWQWHYDSPQFNTQATITILEVYVRSTGSPVAPFNFPSWKVTMGTAITDYQVVNHDPTFALNWSGDEMIVRQGPWVGPGDPVGGTWMPMGITNPFVYNPTLGDFIVQIEKCGTIAVWGTSMDGANGSAGTGGGNRYGDQTNCTATVHSFNNNEYVPLIKIDYILGGTPPPQEFQVNTDEAKLTLNGSSSNGFVATVLTQDVEVDPLGTLITPAAGTLAMSSTVAGSIYDILLNGSPTVPLSGAGLQIAPTEIVNLNLASGWTSLNSSLPLDVSLQNFPGSSIPGASGGGINMPYSMGPTLAPATVSIQAVATDPGSPAGFRLSGALQLDVNLLTVFPPYSTCPSTVGGDLSPLSDDGTINVALVAPFTFYGVTYSDINVNMNGNATFTAGDTDFTATEGEFLSGSPRIAPAWDDWTPSDASQGTVRTSDDGVTFACEWFDIRAFGCTGGVGDTATFCIELDYGTGQVSLSYGQFVSCSSLGTVLAGIGPGAALSLPNNVDLWDATLTAPNNNGPTLGATDAIYESFGLGTFGAFDLAGDASGTPVGSLHIPVAGNGIAFLPTAGIGVGPYIQN